MAISKFERTINNYSTIVKQKFSKDSLRLRGVDPDYSTPKNVLLASQNKIMQEKLKLNDQKINDILNKAKNAIKSSKREKYG